MTRQHLVRLALLSSAAVIALLVFAPRATGRFDFPVYDFLLRGRAAASTSPVAVVAIDDRSLEAIGQWPWPRHRIAELVKSLRAMGASTIALDLLFAEPDRPATASSTHEAGSSDRILAEALDGTVILGYALTFDEPITGQSNRMPPPASIAVIDRPGLPSPSERLFQARACVCILPALASSRARSGFLNVGVDADGTLRRAPLLMAHREHLYPSLALASVAAHRPDTQVTIESQAGVPLRLTLDRRAINLGERGTVNLRFRSADSPFSYISAIDVMNGVADSALLTGRLAFVGITALGVRDEVVTPFNRQMPGIEMQATVAENLLEGSVIAPAPFNRLAQSVVTLGVTLMVAAAIIRCGYRRGAAAGAASVGLTWFAAAVALNRWGIYLSPLAPTVSAVAAIGGAGWLRASAERQRAEIEQRRRERAHEFIARSLTSLVEIRDRSTGQHARRTQGYSRLLLRPLARFPEYRDYLTPERMDTLALLAPLHDIGKVGIRDAVLNKPGALTADELAEMRQHPVYGYETILRAEQQSGVDGDADLAILQLAKDIVYTHHERWDGTGYPRGLRGTEIPLAGRVVAVVDVYDALVEPRPYRRQLPHSEAVALILAGRGTQFDPQVVEAFLSVSESFADLRSFLPTEPAPLMH